MAKQSKVKTNAMRLLDKRHIPYTAFTYPETLHSAPEVAQALDVPVDQVFKTLVVFADEGWPLLVVAPGNRELEPRLVAHAVGAKQVHMAPRREAERLTGLKVGGISPLALLDKHFAIYLDESAAGLEEIYINGGQRGVNLRLRVTDLLAVTGAKLIRATDGSEQVGESEV